MFKTVRLVTATLTIAAAMDHAALAQTDVRLSHVAAELGYTYAWLGPENAVALTRPGVVILVRPGENFVEVNDRTEMTESAPRAERGELYVTPALANQIRRISGNAPVRPHASGVSSAPVPRGAVVAQRSTSGVISLDARPLAGSEALLISGSGPAAVPLTITLLATVSSDVPTAVVSRTDIVAGADGRFQTAIPIAPDYVRGSILTVTATAANGASSRGVNVVVGPPNGGVTVPIETLPKSVR
jgi:hypothetical protein